MSQSKDMTLRRSNCWFYLFAAAIVIGILAASSTGFSFTSQVIEIESDERYEVMKALLWCKGYALYGKLWNDQPPLFTIVLGSAFKLFGSTIGIARSIALGFGVLLFSGLFVIVKRKCGTFAAYAATIYLLFAPQTYKLCVSAMLEVPAYATAIWALWPLMHWSQDRGARWLLLSGLILSLALQIKLTAALVAPPLFLELLLNSRGATLGLRLLDAAKSVGVCATSCLIGFVAIGVLSGARYDQMWQSHFSGYLFPNPSDAPRFSCHYILEHTETAWAASAGCAILLLKRDFRRVAIPIAFLIVALAVHSVHRPWWQYYYLHLAIPLAWLSGYGLSRLFQYSCTIPSGPGLCRYAIYLGSLLAAISLSMLIYNYGWTRLSNEIDRIKNLPCVDGDPIVAKMKHYGGSTKWVYADNEIYPFHAQLLMIPDLAVLVAKRFWSGQITPERVWAIIEEYKPDQILLNMSLHGRSEAFITANYVLVYEGIDYRLYVRRELVAESPNSLRGH